MKDIKLYGLYLYGFTLIPCYYDVVRYGKKITMFASRRTNIINFENVWYHWSKMFNTNLK